MTPTIQDLPIDKIRRDSGAQYRVEGLSAIHVNRLKEALERGKILKPISVFYDGSQYWMGDGDHRIEATRLFGKDTITADVYAGTQLDAQRFGRSANEDHGLPRKTKDKKNAVLAALQDPEWQGWSFNKIAKTCEVAWYIVKEVATDNGLTSTNREVTYQDKHGNVGTMNTANLGKQPVSADDLTSTIVEVRPAPNATPEPPAPPPSSTPQNDGRDLSAYPVDYYDDYDTSDYIPEYESDETTDTTPPAPLSPLTNAPQQAAPTAPTAPATPTAPTGRTGSMSQVAADVAEEKRRELEARIEALPLAQALSLYGHKGHLFKEQARLWYENEKVRSAARMAASQVRHTSGPFSEAVRQLARVAKADPSEWEGCAACKGSTRVGERADPCELCKGGFTIYQGQGVSAEVVAARARGHQAEEVAHEEVTNVD